MINEFDFEACRDSAILYQSIYKQVARKYKRGKYEEAAELALSYMQIMLNGYTTTDDEDIQDMLEPYVSVSKKANERYSRKLQKDAENQIKELLLEEIASMINEGKSYAAIADSLNIAKSTVSYRVGIIKEKYPELLSEVQDGNSVRIVRTVQSNDNDNDNDNDNVKENDKEKEKENVGEFGQAELPASASASDNSSVLSLIEKYKPFRNDAGMVVFQEVPRFDEMEQINSYLSMHPEAINAAHPELVA